MKRGAVGRMSHDTGSHPRSSVSHAGRTTALTKPSEGAFVQVKALMAGRPASPCKQGVEGSSPFASSRHLAEQRQRLRAVITERYRCASSTSAAQGNRQDLVELAGGLEPPTPVYKDSPDAPPQVP